MGPRLIEQRTGNLYDNLYEGYYSLTPEVRVSVEIRPYYNVMTKENNGYLFHMQAENVHGQWRHKDYEKCTLGLIMAWQKYKCKFGAYSVGRFDVHGYALSLQQISDILQGFKTDGVMPDELAFASNIAECELLSPPKRSDDVYDDLASLRAYLETIRPGMLASQFALHYKLELWRSLDHLVKFYDLTIGDIKAIIKEIGIPPQASFHSQAVPLAAKSDNEEAVRYLVEAGMDVDEVDRSYRGEHSALYYACLNNNTNLALFLLKKGASLYAGEPIGGDYPGLLLRIVKENNNAILKAEIKTKMKHPFGFFGDGATKEDSKANDLNCLPYLSPKTQRPGRV